MSIALEIRRSKHDVNTSNWEGYAPENNLSTNFPVQRGVSGIVSEHKAFPYKVHFLDITFRKLGASCNLGDNRGGNAEKTTTTHGGPTYGLD